MILENIELGKLRGITVAYEDDLYEFAEVVLKIMYSTDKMGRNTISKPTINGLARDYSMICGEKISQNQILDIAKKNGLDGNDGVDFDKGDKRRYEPPKIGLKISDARR